MSTKTYFSRHIQNLLDFSNSIFKAMVLLGLLIFILHPAVIFGQSPPPNIQNTGKASDVNLRSNLKVNPSTHAVEFEITLANYPGRGGLGVPVKLSYSSKVWRVAYQSYTPSSSGETLEGFTSVNAWFNGGWTSSVGVPVILHDDDASRYSQFGLPLPETTDCNTTPCYRIDRMFIRMPNDTVHELRSSDEPYSVSNFFSLPIPTPDDLYAVDGSQLRYQRSTQTLFFPDGSRFIFSTTTPRLIDKNGNTLTYTAAFPFNLQNNIEVGVTDTLGRAIPAFRKTFANNTDVVYSLPGLNNVPTNYTFKWKRLGAPGVLTTPQSLHYIAEFGCPPAAGQEPPASGVPHLFSSDFSNRTFICNGIELFDPVVLHQILLPTGQSYTFTYNVYGEIEKVVLPSGGYERYEYESLMPLSVTAPLYSQANRGVKKRHVSKTGNLADEITWNYAFTGTFPYGSGNPGTYILTTTAPDQSLTDRYLHTDSLLGSFGFNIDQGKSGMIYDERQWSAPNGSGVRQLLQRKLTEWVTTGSNASNQIAQQNAKRNARVAKEVAILLATGTASALTQTTVHNYDLTFQFNIGAMGTSVAQYDWVVVSQSTAQSSPISSFTTPSQPLRRSETTNLLLDTNIAQATRDAYRARHLVALPSSTRVKNGAGTIVAQTSMQYDQYSLTTVGSVSGWIDPQNTHRGNLTISGRWLNTTGNYLQTHNTFDQFGNVRTATDAKGNQSQIGYSSNHAYATTTTTAIPDPSGQHGSTVAFTSTTNYDVTSGLMLSTTDSNGQTTSMDYSDPLNRLTQITQSDGAHTTYIYSDAPSDLYVRVLTDLDSSRVMETRTYFDGIGRVVRNFLYDGTPSTPWTVTDTYYDTMGRISKVSNPYRVSSPSGIVPSTCSVCTTTAYDALGRVTSVITSDNAQTSASYGGNTTGILGPTVLATDAAGKARKNVMDALGRLVAVYENPTGLNYETLYTYDLLGNRTGVTQGTQPPRSFVYDSLSRLVSAMNPESGTMGYQYDNNGNITQKTDARGIISTYTYDALNRNKTVDYSDTAISPDVSRIYDGASNGKGRLWRNYAGGTETTGSNVEKTLIHSYDALGRPLIQKQSFKVNGVWFLPDYQITRTYNRAGAVATQTYPSGRSVTYNYDAAGRLGDKDGQNFAFTGDLGGPARTYSKGILYAASGQLRQEQFGTNTPVYHKLHYNERQQLCDVRASNVNDEWGGELGALVNYYHTPVAHCVSGANNNGNVVMSQTILNTVYFEDRYTYDALNRLTAVSEYVNGSTLAGSQQYDYDRWGNRNIIPSSLPLGFNTAFEKQDATNRLYAPGDLALPDTSRRIRYDAAGNQIKNTFTGYGQVNFDAENHITSIQDNLGGTSNYTYNADGQRTRRKISNQETWQIYGFDGELLAEYAANTAAASPQKEYGYRNGQLLVTTGAGAIDTVWSDDAVPAGAAIAGDGESWNWVSSNPAPFSGSTAHQSNVVAGLHQHYFYGATATLSVSAGDKLVAYVYLDPSNMPSQIMLQFAEGGSWEHRAYWGANNLPWGVDGTNSRRYMGPLPAAGTWVRLEVPASLVGLEGLTLHGMAFSMWGGRATWDRVGKTNSTVIDTAWSDDGVPTGAAIASDNESWNWVSSNPAPFSGSLAHQSGIVAGLHQHYFYGATATLSVNTGDKLLAYVYLDPSNMPSQIMLQFAEGGSWEHRAYWGANNLPWGVDGTNSRRYMGPLPAAGSWVRLEVPASLVGLEGFTLHGMAFSMWGGRATWDRAGKTSSGGAGSSLQWLVSDHLGTPRMVIDQTGTLANVKRHDYLPFGEELFAGRSGLGYGGADGIRQQFTAKERDIETALDYFGARYYSSTQGRFTSFDPEGAGARESDPQSWNGYAYAGGNPVLFSDPDGREYRVCDPSGKTCTTVSDQEFHDERKALQATGNVYTGNGNFYERGQIRNAEGAVVAEYVQFSIDDLQHRQLAAIAAAVDPIPMATLQFFGLSAVIGTTGGVAYYVLGPTAAITTLRIGGERIVPPLARRILDEIKNRNGSPPPGHKGGKPFKNDGRDGGEVLPRTDSSGNPITYREYDVNPYQSGVNRGTERIVVGSDKRAYYTNDHYKTFTRIE